MSMRILPCADAGLLVELADLDQVLALYTALADDPPAGVLDVVPAARTVLLRLDDGADAAAVEQAVREVRPAAAERTVADPIAIPVVYDGADLEEVGELTGLGVDGVVRAHTSGVWTVAFGGFVPGFGYLVGGDERLRVPRRDTPRTRVPAGAVALAGEFAGVYPRESPGGWQLIGRTRERMWDLDRDPPALLSPGARVRFVEVS